MDLPAGCYYQSYLDLPNRKTIYRSCATHKITIILYIIAITLAISQPWHHPNNATATPVKSRLGQILEQKYQVDEEVKQQSSDTVASSPHATSVLLLQHTDS